MAYILGVTTGELSFEEAWAAILSSYDKKEAHLLVTPNPEIILGAQKDEELFYLLNRAEISIADGFGLKLVAWLSGQKIKRATGADLLPKILEEASEKKRKLLIINRKDGLSSVSDIKTICQKRYPGIILETIETEKKAEASQEEIEKAQNFEAQIALCFLGSPYQEKYLFHLKDKLSNLSLAAALGGSFDFISGKQTRAPKFLRKMGLEWLFRLYKQPWRWQRIIKATIVFMARFFYSFFFMPHLYRPNVAVLMYREGSDGEKEIFVVEREGEPGHWQIPQGGRDGESLEKAGLREIAEEANAKEVEVKGAFPNLHRYEFKYSGREYKRLRHLSYKGQKQGLLIVEFKGREEDIKIQYWDHSAWRWVKESQFVSTCHPSRQEAYRLYLEKLKSLEI